MVNKIIKSIIIGFFILFPVFYLTVTPDSYEYNKMALLVVITLLLLFFTALKIVQEKRLMIIKNRFTYPLFLLAAAYLISTLFQSPNIITSLITPLSTSTILAGFIFFILLIYNLESHDIAKIVSFIVIDAALISGFVLLQQTGVLPNNSYTPAGTLLSTTIFLAIISLYLLVKIINNLRGEGKNFASENIILHFLTFLLTCGTTIFLTIQLTTSAKPILLPFSFGWIILLEVLKNVRTLFLGVGPANFIAAFSLTKPLSFNSTPYWNVIFTSSSSFLLNIITETGILAGLFYIVILLKSLKLLQRPTTKDRRLSTIPLLFSLILLIFLPAGMSAFITVIIFLGVAGTSESGRVIRLERIGILRYLILLPVILFIMGVAYFGGKFYLAEVIFKQSLDALVNNQAEKVYTLQQQAISVNPQVDRYHVAFSRTSLALANGIASKKDLTETDKQNIPNLVKQSIEEARTAVVLNRLNEINWDNLGRIYSSLIGYAAGSENWAAYSFQQKLILDPTNPNTYLALVGLNLQLNKWKEAESLSISAIRLKPDLANAHYFLSLSLQGQKRYKEAYTTLQKTYSLLAADSTDGQKVAGELEQLAKLVPGNEATTSAVETAPAPDQVLEVSPATPSALQNAPETVPTISLQQPPGQ